MNVICQNKNCNKKWTNIILLELKSTTISLFLCENHAINLEHELLPKWLKTCEKLRKNKKEKIIMNVIEEEYKWIFNFLEKTNLKEKTEQVIKEKIEVAKSTISDMNNEIIKIKKESKIKNFFVAIFTFGKINKNKENKIKIMKINEKINKLKKVIIKWNLFFEKKIKNENCQKWVNSINNSQTQTNEQNNYCSNSYTVL